MEAPLDRRERERLGLDEGDVWFEPGADRAATGKIEVALGTSGEGDANWGEAALEALGRLWGDRAVGVVVAPCFGQDDRHRPAAPGELEVDLLVDAHHSRVADHQQSPVHRQPPSVASSP